MASVKTTTQDRSAFTLVELLVVIAIIGILVALLLPAVQSARAAARRTQCTSSVKQVTLAMLNYHDVTNGLPLGMSGTMVDGYDGTPGEMSWFPLILPYIEEQALFDSFDWNQPYHGSVCCGAWPTHVTVVSVMMCPSDGANPKSTSATQGFHGNYVMNSGDTVYNRSIDPAGTDLNGLFYAHSHLNYRRIEDGTSKTLMASELIIVPDRNGHDVRGRYYNSREGSCLFSTLFPPNSSVGDSRPFCQGYMKEAPCGSGGFRQSVRSYHVGGVNSSMADGSVRFTSNNIDSTTFQRLGNRHDGQVVGDF